MIEPGPHDVADTAADDRRHWLAGLGAAAVPLDGVARPNDDSGVDDTVSVTHPLRVVPGDDATLDCAVVALVARYGFGEDVIITTMVDARWTALLVGQVGDPTVEQLRAAVSAGRSATRVEDFAQLLDQLHAAQQPTTALTRITAALGRPGWPLPQPADLAVRIVGGDLLVTGRRAVFDPSTVTRLAAHLARLLDAMAGCADTVISRLPMLAEDETTDLVARGRRGEPFPHDPLHVLFGRRAAAQPDAIAVIDATTQLSYAELDARADGLAARLAELGVGLGSLVGVCVERSTDMLVALLGILKSGAGYVPIDPGYPAERIAMMFADADLKVIVTQREVEPRLPAMPAVAVFVEDVTESVAAVPAVESHLDDVAYVIFTSGSTGRPKGVTIEHRALLNFLESMAHEPGLCPSDRLLAVTTLSFDIAGLELYLPLYVGATVVLASAPATADPNALIRLLEDQAITVMQATPATWQMLLDAGWSGRAGLRVLCGGEAVSRVLAAALLDRVAEVWNMYGPTETTIWSTVSRLVPGAAISIGRPIANTRVYVTGVHGELMPAGAPGELLIGGDGVARGYLGRDDLTAERFVADPAVPGERAYRTGDLVRYSPDGQLDYLGRIDNQVKIRGFRIELREVEIALDRHPAVTRSVAVAYRSDPAGPFLLVAYVTLDAASGANGGELRASLRDRLPEYMVPSVVVVLDAFPLTPNGKLDRRRLPAPVIGGSTAERVAACTPTEHMLVASWQKHLRTSEFGVTDNIFDLGADSLTVARVYAAVGTQFAVTLPLAPAFAAPTIRECAALIDALRSRASTATRRHTALAPIQSGGTRRPLFLVHGGAGTILLFEPLARRLGPDQPVYGLQAVGLYGIDSPQRTVPEMARRYLAELRTVQPRGPYHIGGYCFGALVAFEIARQLHEQGEHTDVLISFNGPSPSYLTGHHPRFDRGGASTDGEGNRRSRTAAAEPAATQLWPWLPAFLDPARPVAGRIVFGTRRGMAKARRAARFEWYLRRGQPLPQQLREASGFQRLAARAQDAYAPDPYAGAMLVISGEGLYECDDLGWANHATGGVEVFSVPGTHVSARRTMAEPLVAPIADVVTRTLAAARERAER